MLSLQSSVKGPILSALIPGLGQWRCGYPLHAARVLVTGASLGIVTWALSRIGGPGAGFFFALMIIVPWWCLQAYEASLPTPPGQMEALKTAWRRAHDIRYLGGLFLFTAFTDLYIILANPEYSLTLFCTKPEGVSGLLAKAQSPTLHLAIGYGFLKLRPWALLVYMAYGPCWCTWPMPGSACAMPWRITLVSGTDAFARCFFFPWWHLPSTCFGAGPVFNTVTTR